VIEEVQIYPKGSKKNLLHRLERIEHKIECERRYHAESLRPLKAIKHKIQSELQKLEQ
tara:strand:- start:1390 stop:1563 length:174 start_codon:yes stop_codon:yes gene_type:complete